MFPKLESERVCSWWIIREFPVRIINIVFSFQWSSKQMWINVSGFSECLLYNQVLAQPMLPFLPDCKSTTSDWALSGPPSPVSTTVATFIQSLWENQVDSLSPHLQSPTQSHEEKHGSTPQRNPSLLFVFFWKWGSSTATTSTEANKPCHLSWHPQQPECGWEPVEAAARAQSRDSVAGH